MAADSNSITIIWIAVTVAPMCIPYADPHQGVSASNGCPTPSLTLNGSAVAARRNSTPDYSTLSEIKFTARMPSPPFGVVKSQYRSCKIKCVAGQWVGPLCKIVEENNADDGRFHPVLRSCKLNLNGTNLVLAQDTGTLLKQWNGRIPDRSMITTRCDGAPGLYKLYGEPKLLCSDGDWNHELPRCLPTSSISAYSEYSPPTIRVKLAFGNSAVDYRNNHVVIYPGSIVHLECLFQRRYGDVRWTRTTVQQQQSNHLLTGWSIAVDEREWIYRMSLYYVRSELDSGDYTCITPNHQNNTVTLKIDAVQCEKRNENERKRRVISSAKTQSYYIGQVIDYSCPHGFFLNGSNRSSCLADGRWSSDVPYCEPIVCPSLLSSLSSSSEDAHLTIDATNNTYGSTIRFRCAFGYALKGANEINCKIDGRWSSSVPKCIDILCAPPLIPAGGYLIEKSDAGGAGSSAGPTYRVGTVIQFACEKPYRVVGQESVACKENGIWSAASPDCRLVCEYPIEPVNGRLFPQKLWYETGHDIKVVCDDGYFISAPESESDSKFVQSIFVTCAKNGTWSRDIPHCVN